MPNENRKLDCTLAAGSAIWHAMVERQVKGRVEARLHAKLAREVRAKLTDAPDKPQFGFKDGVIELAEDVFEYLLKIVEHKMESGVPGSHGAGYGELIEAIEPHEEKH